MLWIMLMITHGLCGFVMLVGEFVRDRIWLYVHAALNVIPFALTITMIYSFQYFVFLV
jgi:hypothetical protein